MFTVFETDIYSGDMKNFILTVCSRNNLKVWDLSVYLIRLQSILLILMKMWGTDEKCGVPLIMNSAILG